MITGKDIYLKYSDGTTALKNINFKIEAGDIVYITGPSGSGKTSLLKLLMGVEYPTAGSLEVLGQTISKDQTAKIRRMRMKIGPVFQEFRLIQGRTAMENVMLGMRFLDISRKQLKEDAKSALEKVGLESKIFSPVDNLSWGQRQRVAIARAIARKPAVILADEPTGNLDKDNAINILELLTSFKDKETAVIITTHATHLIRNSEDTKIIQLNNGSILRERMGLA